MSERYAFYHQFYDAAEPVNILTIGVSDVDDSFYCQRDKPLYHCIQYVTGGNGVVETPDGIFPVGAGDVFLLYKDVPHALRTAGGRWEKMWVEFEGALFDAMLTAFLPDRPIVVHCPEAETEIRQIVDWADEKETYSALCVETVPVILQILQKLNAALHQGGKSLASQIRAWIDRHLCEDVTLADMQKDIYYSENHIINVFSGTYGVTPYQYYAEKRTEMVQHYLTDTVLSIGEIAAILNFRDAKYLSTFFRHRCGMTPTMYRKLKSTSSKKTDLHEGGKS